MLHCNRTLLFEPGSLESSTLYTDDELLSSSCPNTTMLYKVLVKKLVIYARNKLVCFLLLDHACMQSVNSISRPASLNCDWHSKQARCVMDGCGRLPDGVKFS